jgi:hypothetical protein
MTLNLVFGGGIGNVFTIRIPAGDNVSFLKDAITGRKAFQGPGSLKLWKVESYWYELLLMTRRLKSTWEQPPGLPQKPDDVHS